MPLDTLPTEIITHIFLSLPSISSALALGATSHHLHAVFHSSKRLFILSEAAEAEYGPIQDIIQLVTHNSSQPTHIRRQVPVSDALIRQIVSVGRVARSWEALYPSKKWKVDYANRRLLSAAERYLLRRAIYRLWLYSKAFHHRGHARTTRALPQSMAERAALLHNFTTPELAELLDVHLVLRDTVAHNICPSNGRIRQKFSKRYPDSNYQLLFNIHLNYPPAPSTFVPDTWFHNSMPASKHHARLHPTRFHEPGAEGWGDDINHYYVVEDMMKLNPAQILHLKDGNMRKSEVEAYVRDAAGEATDWMGGGWFANNGETFSETLGFVLKQRGDDLQDVKAWVEDYELGVIRDDDGDDVDYSP
nr:hypothetical protein CFP56_34779 [Quercus suber]